MLRIIKKGLNVELGTVLDIDGTRYSVSEIQFKTPSDHTIKGHQLDLEVQIIHEAVSGDYKASLILSILYKKKAGAKLPFFNYLDILSLPNPNSPENPSYLHDIFNINMFTN